MQFDADEFDAQHFDYENASEEECWAAIPFLEGSMKAHTLNHLGGLAFERSDFAKASMLADQAAVEWQRIGCDFEAAKCYSNAGSCLHQNGEIEQAITFYGTAASIASDAREEEFYANTNMVLSQIHLELFDFEKSLEFSLLAMHAAETLDNNVLKIHSYESVGTAYGNLGQTEIALDFFQKGLELSSQQGSIKHAASFRPLIATCYRLMNRPDLAVDEIVAARELSLLMNDAVASCERGNQLSEIHRELGNFDLAIEIAESVKQMAIKERFPKQAARANANIGHALNRLGHYESAYQQLSSAAEIMKMAGDFANAVFVEADAAHSALGLGNIPLAQLRLSGCEKTSTKINFLESPRELDLNNRQSTLSLVKLQLELAIQLAAEPNKPFSLLNQNMEYLFEIQNKAAFLENQGIVNEIVAMKPEFIVAGGIPELTSPEGELLTKTLAELIDEKFFVDDPSRLARFHELQALVRKDLREGFENLTLAVTYYLDAGKVEKAGELSSKLQFQLANRSEISRARAINSRIY